MWLNLGCGGHRAPQPWLNVDSYQGPGVDPDVVADITEPLPFVDGDVGRVYCGHVLEHIELDALPAVLGEIRRVLAPDGMLCVVGPDCDRVELDPEWHALRDAVRYGGRRWLGDEHRWYSTGPATAALLRPVFPTAHEIPVGEVDRDVWPLVDDPGWQFAIVT